MQFKKHPAVLISEYPVRNKGRSGINPQIGYALMKKIFKIFDALGQLSLIIYKPLITALPFFILSGISRV